MRRLKCHVSSYIRLELSNSAGRRSTFRFLFVYVNWGLAEGFKAFVLNILAPPSVRWLNCSVSFARPNSTYGRAVAPCPSPS